MRSRTCLVAVSFCFVAMASLASAVPAWATAPTITSIGPNNGRTIGGVKVTITGTGFISGTTVKFGSTSATGVSIKSSTSLTAFSPAGAGTVGISVTNANGTSSSTPYDQFGYDPAPTNAWLGLNGNSSTYLGPVDAFVEHSIVYDRSGAIEWEAGQLPEAGDGLAKDVENGMVPDITIEYKGYPGCEWGHECLPTGTAITTYVTGFVKSAEAILKKYPGQQILFEPINEPYGYGTAAQYAAIVAKLLPEIEKAGIPLSDVYVAAYGKKWVPKMYEAQSKLKTEIQGWYFHPYGPPKGTAEENSEGIESLPIVQAEMTSGQNNIIVSEAGYCPEDVHSGEDCHGDTVASSTIAAADLTEMLEAAVPYYEAGWLRSLIVYSRNDGGWAMQLSGGTLTKQGEAMIAFSDAHKWAQQPTPNPGPAGTVLEAVACPLATTCTAVGYVALHAEEAGENPAAEKWNGTTWSSQTIPTFEGFQSVRLSGVACLSTENCRAVGYYFGEELEGKVGAFAEHWNGTSWTAESVASPGTAEFSLEDISCTSPSACTAVGIGGVAGTPLIERWNGTSWAVQTPAGHSGQLFDVSCTSSTFCMTVGNSGSTLLVETWDGTTWSLATTPEPTGSTYDRLSGVSCTSSSACTTVGSYYDGSKTQSLAERWNGSSWTIQTTPSPSGINPRLTSVACTSATTCVAIGEYDSEVYHSYYQAATLAERWSSEKWTIQRTPSVTEAEEPRQLRSVECISATRCTTVGSSLDVAGFSSAYKSLAETSF